MRKKSLLALIVLFCLLNTMVTVYAAEDKEVFHPSLFAGKRIGIQTGSVYTQRAGEFVENPELYYFDSVPDAVTALVAGKVDAVLEDRTVLQYAAAATSGLHMENVSDEKIPIGFVAAKTERGAELLAELNPWIESMRTSGELERLEDKWCNGTEEDRVMESYENLPAVNGSISIATEPLYPPLEYIKDGEIVGFDIELMRLFCKEHGYGLAVNTVTFSGILTGVVSEKYDLGVSGINITEERKKSVDFTEPVLINSASILFSDALLTGEKTNFLQRCKDGFQRTFLEENRWELFRDGLLVTLRITLLSALFGTALGFLVYLLCRGGKKLPSLISRFCRWLIKGMPEVVFLMILFYIIFRGSSITGEWTGIVGFSLLFACTVHEILQGAELALPSGQALAAKSLGYSELQSFFHVIFPQMLPFALPSYMTEIGTHIKATAIVGYIAVVDLTKVSDIVRGITYDPFFSLLAVAILYFVLAAILRLGVKLLSRKTDPRRRSEKQILKGLVIR